MAKQLATKEAVFEAAYALVAEGVEPSILTVQSRIGGGSYTTIKRLLDEWMAQRVMNEHAAVEIPSFVQEKTAELGRTLWTLATREAQKDTQAAKDAAEAKVTGISKELEFAQSEIRRMEEVEEAQHGLLESTRLQLSGTEASLAEARVQASKVPELKSRLSTTLAELTAARQESTDRAVEAGRLSGEAESLRNQVRDLTSALVSLKAIPSAGA